MILEWSALFGQHDIDFQHFVAILLFQRDADVVGVDLDVLGDDGDQFALQVGQESWRCCRRRRVRGR
jgi:hypothetical protein